MRIGIAIALVMAPTEDHMIMAQIVNLLSLWWTPLISHPHYPTDIHILTDSLDIRLEDIHKFPIQINIPLLLPRQECTPRWMHKTVGQNTYLSRDVYHQKMTYWTNKKRRAYEEFVLRRNPISQNYSDLTFRIIFCSSVFWS